MQKTKENFNLDKKTDNDNSSYYEKLLNVRKKSLKEKETKKFQWLTDHSRNFLAAGYVAEGVKPEERIREIADRAQEILKIDGFSDKFYNYMEKGFYSLSSPVWSNFGKKEAFRLAVLGPIYLMIWGIFYILNQK